MRRSGSNSSPRVACTYLLALLLTLPALASAQPKASSTAPPRSAPLPLTFVLGLEWFDDDNILQLTPSDLARFASNPAPPRFLIESTDDNVLALHGDAYAHFELAPRRDTRFGVSFDASDYQRNDVKDWHEFGLSFAQELTASRRNLSALSAWWSRVPDFYLLQITDADDSFAAGTRIRRSLSYEQSTAGVRVDQELMRGRAKLALGYERVTRDYNESFNERDNHNDQWKLTGEVRPFPNWGASARITYLVGRLRAEGDLPSSPIVDADVSYDHQGIGAAVSLPWGRGRTRGRLEASLMPEVRDFQTSDKFDVRRFGRENHRLETVVRVIQRVWGPFEAIATYDKLSSDASFDSGLVFPEDQTDFDQTRLGLMLRGRWDLRDSRSTARDARP